MVWQLDAEDGHVVFGGFLNRNAASIQSPDHESGLIGVLQLPSEHPYRIVITLGCNNHATWFQNKIDTIFRANGPLGGSLLVSTQVLQDHPGAAQQLAQTQFDITPSNDTTGCSHEDVL